jgi:hypothetical protein
MCIFQVSLEYNECNVFLCFQQAGDIALEAGQLQHALELYQASKVKIPP